MSIKYLYGASVDGIQQFIFESGRLRDIVGASALVHGICTSLFGEFEKDGESIVRAAGTIKHLFDSEEACRDCVRRFPRKVAQYAAGLNISQAVVEVDETKAFSDAVRELESKLRTARNRSWLPLEIGFAGIERSRTTGRPAVRIENGEHLDATTLCKRRSEKLTRTLSEKAFGVRDLADSELAYDIEDITEKNAWIAIVHADGNGLGKIVRTIGNDKEVLALFSATLDEATTLAANDAFSEVVAIERGARVIPMRPIVLAGDDFTFVVRGDLALRFTNAFLTAFRKRTQTLFAERILKSFGGRLSKKQQDILGQGLTACAGIAFVKASYPFYYGYQLAEALCADAKAEAKRIDADLAPSCLMFHKVQDSFVEDYRDIVERELTPCAGLSYKFGPYYVEPQYGKWTVEKLLGCSATLADEDRNNIKTSLRRWLTEIATNGLEAARQFSKRAIEVHPESRSLLEMLFDYSSGATPVYDLLSINSVENTATR